MKKIYTYIFVAAALLSGFSLRTYAQQPDPTDAIHLSKVITPVDADNGKYTIDLETYVTGTSVTTVTTTSKPVDLVLVLDVSSSMDRSSGSQETTARKSQSYTYNQAGNGTYGYMHTDGTIYKVYQERTNKVGGTRYYRLFFRDSADNKHYLSGEGITDTAPTNVTADNKTIYTGVLYEYRNLTRLEVLKKACVAFIDKVADNAKGKDNTLGTSDDIKHRISIVTFDKHEHYITGNTTDYEKSRTDADKTNNFTPIYDTYSGNVAILKQNIQELTLGSGTRQDRGILAAKNNIDAIDATRFAESSKVIVMFTDGEPYGSNEVITDEDHPDGHSLSREEVANKAIEYAKPMKNREGTYKAQVFSVTMAITNQTYINYMKYISSNYPDAVSASNPGTPLLDGGFYFDAGEGENLESIFEAIASSSTVGGETIELNESSTSVIDVVSDNFLIPAGTKVADITCKVMACTGVDENGNYTWVDKGQAGYYGDATKDNPVLELSSTDDAPWVDDNDHSKGKIKNKISVTNFNYGLDDVWDKATGNIVTKGNWVGPRTKNGNTDHWGKKVVISFPVEVNPDYEGGYAMPSNDIESGIYVDGKKIKPYPVPSVDTPSICIMKDGLKIGESAIFEITSSDDASVHYTVVLTQKELTNSLGRPAPCYIVIKRLTGNKDYTVTEKTNWSWMYTTTKTSITQELISANTFGITAAALSSSPATDLENNSTRVGRQINAKDIKGTNPDQVYCILLNKTGDITTDDLSGGAISLLYHFTNTRVETGKPARAEAYVNNKFEGGKTTGGTEAGGSEEEDI